MAAGPGLHDMTASWPSVIAVCDGAKFDDLPALLRANGFVSHALLLDSPRQPSPRSGPWMLHLPSFRLGQFLSIPGMERSCVLWGGCDDPGDAFQHFRRINRAEIPDAQGRRESVLFRHWDNETLALLMPIATPAQKARLFGPFDRVALFCEDADGALVAQYRPEPGAAALRGPLRFDAAQMVAIEGAMRARSDRRVARYLRRNAPAHTGQADDATMQRYVEDCRVQAETWGVTSEAGIGRFAWLQLVTQGRFAQMPEVHALMSAPSTATPDRRLTYLMQRMGHVVQGVG
ncbi:DUF4123 domain-containing protein [Novosphingobium album (ex Liu et al. 2023)]|uniref:DUF4123 domain-containing protein n=1 Tax=Novosphingobium album (ex Liu et al. 2023) TaxID=3031130 RepID=A0ABT5WV26_9SPHN|nr:DUF4123 domain-containing protein [Novosphingobium album (ex Liu et al. 2023)]MDE8653721.1 DUF4123 domain-containing protein [Novosphingobium album (ex Liu et al. 2023)]